MTRPLLSDVPVRSAEELTHRWEALLDPPEFDGRSLWLAWLDSDGRMLPALLPVDGLPELPDMDLLEGVRRVHNGVAAQHLQHGGHLAVALCRPGLPDVTEQDVLWAEAMREALDGMPLPSWSLHLAAGGAVTDLTELTL